MKHFAGLYVSLRDTSICVVDVEGTTVIEGKVPTEPGAILEWIADRVGAVERIVQESGPLAIWLTRELARLGAPSVCIDARAAHKALSSCCVQHGHHRVREGASAPAARPGDGAALLAGAWIAFPSHRSSDRREHARRWGRRLMVVQGLQAMTWRLKLSRTV